MTTQITAAPPLDVAEVHDQPNVVGLAAAISQAGQGVVMTDRFGNILYANSAFAAMTGYSIEEVMGGNPRVLKSGTQDPSYYKELWATITAGRNWHGELINRRKDGSLYVEEMTIAPVLDSEGKIDRYIALKQDVTERRKIEEERRFLAAIVASSGDAIIGMTLSGTISSWNQGAEGIYGYRVEEVIGKPISLLWPPGQQEEMRRLTKTLQAGLPLSQFETIRITKDGRPIEVELTMSPIRDPAGSIVGVASIARDISERRRAERALLDSGERFRALFERSLDCLYIQDFDGRFLELNPAASKMLGYEREDLGLLNLSCLVSPEQMAKTEQAIRELRETGTQKETTELTLRCKSGSLVDVEKRSAVIPWERTSQAILSVARDITGRKRTEEALRESEERFRTMSDSCPTMIWVTDSEGEIRFVNRAHNEFFNITSDQVEGGNWQPTVHPADIDVYRGAFLRALERREPFRADGRVLHASGEWRWVTSYAEPRWSPGGEFLGHVGLSLDITERKQAEEALKKSDEKFRLLAENIHQVFWISDMADGSVLYISPGYETVFGRSCESLYRDPVSWLDAVEPEDREKAPAVFQRQVQGERCDSEYRIRTPQGELKWIMGKAFLVCDESGRSTRIVGISEDITAWKQAQEALREAKEAAEMGNRAKSEFLANMSHEIRTPLNGVIASSELLSDTPLNEEQQKYAQMIGASGESLLNIINDILDYSKIEARRIDLEVIGYDVRRLVDESLAVVSVKAQAKKLQLESDVASDVPCGALGDPTRLRQVILNLLANGIKFTAAGGVRLQVSQETGRRGCDLLRFEIVDTGIGISPEQEARLFRSFSQADSSTTRKYGGTGLGLAISKQLIELMGGEIGVTSKRGAGSTFWFTVPMKARDSNPPEQG